MSLHTLCKPRSSVFAADRRATVLNLDTFLKGQKLRSTALSLHAETVERMLREHLESCFSASLRDCY